MLWASLTWRNQCTLIANGDKLLNKFPSHGNDTESQRNCTFARQFPGSYLHWVGAHAAWDFMSTCWSHFYAAVQMDIPSDLPHRYHLNSSFMLRPVDNASYRVETVQHWLLATSCHSGCATNFVAALFSVVMIRNRRAWRYIWQKVYEGPKRRLSNLA